MWRNLLLNILSSNKLEIASLLPHYFIYIFQAKTISRARLDGSEQSVVIHSNGMPDSIAIDPLARNIYWTDPVTDTISVAKLDGNSRKVIRGKDPSKNLPLSLKTDRN